jgi:hypothetical protein
LYILILGRRGEERWLLHELQLTFPKFNQLLISSWF